MAERRYHFLAASSDSFHYYLPRRMATIQHFLIFFFLFSLAPQIIAIFWQIDRINFFFHFPKNLAE
jgi:hypothetical protein